jgi:hypothetical protein
MLDPETLDGVLETLNRLHAVYELGLLSEAQYCRMIFLLIHEAPAEGNLLFRASLGCLASSEEAQA